MSVRAPTVLHEVTIFATNTTFFQYCNHIFLFLPVAEVCHLAEALCGMSVDGKGRWSSLSHTHTATRT